MQNYKQISDKYAFSLDNRQIAFLGTGVLGMLLLFFLLGVLYGTRLGPSRGFSNPLPSLPMAAQPAPEAAIPAEAAPETRAPAASAAATQSERVFELNEENLSASSKPSLPERAPKASAAAALPAPREEVPAEKPAPVVARAAPEEPTSGAAASQMSGDYTVQVGSFTRAGDAERLVEKLGRAGYPAYMARGIVNGTTYYRVRVGKYQTRDEASRMASRVKRAEAMDAFATRVN